MEDCKGYQIKKQGFFTRFVVSENSGFSTSEIFPIISNPVTEGGRLLHKSKTTSVYSFEVNGRGTILKDFTVRNRNLLKSTRKYAFSEFENILKAKGLGVRVPDVYIYYERIVAGPRRHCGLVMEELSDYVQFSDALYQGRASLFDIIPVLVGLYKLGVNHTDVSPYNVFFHRDDGSYALIDWQQASFLEPDQPDYLVWGAKQFFDYLRIAPGDELRNQWISTLHQQSGMTLALDVFRQRVDQLWCRGFTMLDRLALNFGF